MVVLTYFAFASAALALFLGPGFLWLRRAGIDPVIALYCGPGLVALAGATTVALGVLLPWSVRISCIGGLVAIVLSAVACAVSMRGSVLPPRSELGGVVAFVLAFVVLAAMAAPPTDPYGDWHDFTVGPHRVDTPRWPGLPADNTLPFRTGQVSLYKQGGNAIRGGYSPGWWLSDRTPLTGLDFAFFAGALGVHVSSQNLEAMSVRQVPMSFKDPFGFWSYQLVAMMLNIAIVLGVYLLARVWLGRREATVAALVAAVLPGLFLNALYTWPKEAIGYFVLIGVACALRRRAVLAGAFAALAYLVHPAGVVWVLPLALVLLRARASGVGRRVTLTRFLAPAAALVAPWAYFTSSVMHATSRWTTAPLGYVMTDPTKFSQQLSVAWRLFRQHGVMYAIWVRAQSTAGSLYPLDLGRAAAPNRHHEFASDIWAIFAAVHGFSLWGMLGLVLFPFAIVVLSRRWVDFRDLTLWLVIPAVVIAELANGEAYPFANQSMFPLVGLLAIIVGVGLLEAARRTRITLLTVAAIELALLAYGALYRPYGIAVRTIVALTAVALLSQAALFVLLARALDLRPPTAARLRSRKAGSAQSAPAAVPSHPAARG